MTKGELMKIANEQIDYMLSHNGKQSKKISKKAKGINPFISNFVMRGAVLERSEADNIVAMTLNEMNAWERYI